MIRLAVLASGTGSNLQAIIDACWSKVVTAQVMVVASDQPAAFALERAINAGIPTVVMPWEPYKKAKKSRSEYDSDLARHILEYSPDLVILAGWMRLLSNAFLSCFPMRVINLHPALPGAFPGTHAIERAWEAYCTGKSSQTGVMVHFVPDEGVDNGPIIVSEIVEIMPSDTLDTLTARIHMVEHRLLISAINQVAQTIEG